MEQHKASYKEEVFELVSRLESTLLELEETPDDMELIGSVFRTMHTIKGSGAMFGFDDIAAFTHEVETVYDLVREGKVEVTKKLIDLTLTAGDQINKMIRAEDVDFSLIQDLISSFRKMIPANIGTNSGADQDFKNESQEPCTDDIPITYRIRFKPNADLFATGNNPIFLLDELREMGQSCVFFQTRNIPLLDELDSESCFLSWDIILTTALGIGAIRGVFIFVEDICELTIDVIDTGGDSLVSDEYMRLGEILIDRGDATVAELKTVLQKQEKIGEMLVNANVVDHNTLVSALAEQEHVKRIRTERKGEDSASSIRVPANKLDNLVDLVGEMVTVQARLSQEATSRKESSLAAIAEEVERLTSELRDNTMSIRMVPIGMTFSRFKRLVRDLSAELGKEVVLSTTGGETELDKTVIERLNDPLVHLIRNCIDHGIESPEIRKSHGKSAKGSVHLSAAHSGADVLIRITDDGAGLDADAIKARAIERGLLAADAEPSNNEIFRFIFNAGFSTAKEVTNVSGRGVGMDVVKRSIETLRGNIDVESTKGKGTTITLKLPLTLAIIDGFMVKVGDGYFVMPLAAVEECVELTGTERADAVSREMINVQGEIVPYRSVRTLFDIDGSRPDIEKVVIVDAGGRRMGLGVDKIIGQYQTVIKALGKIYKDVSGLSGATIMGDGSVALILDLDGIGEIAAQSA
jgi:two-component system, chemotaxis family, sensor kinase CheA